MTHALLGQRKLGQWCFCQRLDSYITDITISGGYQRQSSGKYSGTGPSAHYLSIVFQISSIWLQGNQIV